MDVLLPSRARTATLLLRSPPLDEDDDELVLADCIIGWKNSNVLMLMKKMGENKEYFRRQIKQKKDSWFNSPSQKKLWFCARTKYFYKNEELVNLNTLTAYVLSCVPIGSWDPTNAPGMLKKRTIQTY